MGTYNIRLPWTLFWLFKLMCVWRFFSSLNASWLALRSKRRSLRYSFNNLLRWRFSSNVSSFGRIDSTLNVDRTLWSHSDFGPALVFSLFLRTYENKSICIFFLIQIFLCAENELTYFRYWIWQLIWVLVVNYRRSIRSSEGQFLD